MRGCLVGWGDVQHNTCFVPRHTHKDEGKDCVRHFFLLASSAAGMLAAGTPCAQYQDEYRYIMARLFTDLQGE